MSERLGRAIIVDNRPGAAGAIGSNMVAKAPADGYTLLMGSTTTISINPALNAKLPYQPHRDFAPVSLVAFVSHMSVVSPDIPARNVKEFVAYAKARPVWPGFASAGAGSPHHLAGEMFKLSAGIDMLRHRSVKTWAGIGIPICPTPCAGRSARFSMQKILPDVGGDTMFTSMQAAYDALSDIMRAVIEPLWAVHDYMQVEHEEARPGSGSTAT